ncbi:AI-2E family transporter [Patescibacteria group bacterium]|nr:AI-2E family transporter [Patescibacteria group bacterium]
MIRSSRPININISTFTILKILIVGVLIYFLYLIKDILAILFVSLIIASAVDPLVDYFQKRYIGRGVSIILIYLIAFFTVFIVVTSIAPPITKEVNKLLANSPEYISRVVSEYQVVNDYMAKHGVLDNLKQSLGSMSSGVQTAASGVFSTVGSIFGGIFSFTLILVITFYMVVEENAIKKLIWQVTPRQYQDYIMGLINRMQRKIGLWLRGQFILSFSIFLLTYIGLSAPSFLSFVMPGYFAAFTMEYALVLAIIAGIAEFVPYMGPMIAAVPAVFLAFAQSPTLAVMVIILYAVIQWVENNILVPKIMQKAVGLNPIVSISVLMIGFKIGGVVGAMLAIPVATATQEMILDIFEYKEKGFIGNGGELMQSKKGIMSRLKRLKV